MPMFLLDRSFVPEELRAHAELDLRNIGPKVWPTLLSNCRARDLQLYHITVATLKGIETLGNTRRLELNWATKISDLTPVYALRKLKSLSIVAINKLSQISGIEELSELEELSLTGNEAGLSPPLRLSSIEPITRLANLVSFSLTNAHLQDDDVTVLARCSRLRHLHLSNQFDRTQIAFLAKKLNGQLSEPLSAHVNWGEKCETCSGDKLMFVGRRMPYLCRECDNARFQKHIHEFEQLVRSA